MLGPVIAVFLARAFLIEKRTAEGVLLGGIALFLLGSLKIERTIAPHAPAIWLSPLMASCVAAYLVLRLFAHPDKAAAEKD
jgi:hypothetical protein